MERNLDSKIQFLKRSCLIDPEAEYAKKALDRMIRRVNTNWRETECDNIRRKNRIDLFSSLCGEAFCSRFLSSRMRRTRFGLENGKPGEVILNLSEEKRSLLKDLTSSDVLSLRVTPIPDYF